MNSNKTGKMSRRAFVGMTGALGMVLAAPAFAISASSAQNYVAAAIADLERLVNSGKTGSALEGEVIRFFRRYSDVPTVARAVIGTPWRGMSASQQKNYVSAFETYIGKKYAGLFDVLKGGAARVTRVRDGGQAGALVDAEFVKAGSAPTRVSMQVSDASGSPKILDMKIDGASLIGTEREQVRAILASNGNNVDALIATLKR